MSFGVITGVWGLIKDPFFIYSSSLGIKTYWEGPANIPYDSQVRVHLGSSSRAGHAQADGNQPGVALFAEDGTLIGRTPGTSKKWAEGSHVDVTVKAERGQDNRPGAYLAISDGGIDAICVAAIEISHPDGSKNSLSGDMVVGCSVANFYYSNKKFGDNYRPVCFWIDRDHSNGLKHQGMSVHLPDTIASQARVKQYNSVPETWCKSAPRFSMHETMRVEDNIPIFWPKLAYNPDGTDKNLNEILHPTSIMSGGRSRARSLTAKAMVAEYGREDANEDYDEDYDGSIGDRPVNLETVSEDIEEGNSINNGTATINEEEKFLEPREEEEEEEVAEPVRRNKRLTGRSAPRFSLPARRAQDAEHHIRSKHVEHSAAMLCNQDISFGPSFTNPEEGLHCDMETKTLYPLCAEGVTETCFDNEEGEIREPAARQDFGIDGVTIAVAAVPKVIKKYAEVVDWE